MSKHTYYLAQNTGWSGRTTWFDDGKSYEFIEQAADACREKRKLLGSNGIDHRVLCVTVEEEATYLDKRTEARHLKKEQEDNELYNLE